MLTAFENFPERFYTTLVKILTCVAVSGITTHHIVDEIQASTIRIASISSNSILLEAVGSIYVQQQYGSDSDVRKGDGLIMHASFPFDSSLLLELSDGFPESSFSVTKLDVDTSEWNE